MFEVGFTEIVLIMGLALLVLGPEKLPKLASQIGRWTGRARAMARQLKTQLDQEVNFQEQRAAHGRGETPSAKAQDAYPVYPPPEQPPQPATPADTGTTAEQTPPAANTSARPSDE